MSKTDTRRARIAKWTNGVFPLLATDNAMSWAAGDKIRCTAEGSTLRLYQIRGTTEKLVVTAQDSSFASGRVGVATHGASSKMDDFIVGKFGPIIVEANTADLSWIAPSKNTDGSNLADLAGFKVFHRSPSNVVTSRNVGAATTEYKWTNLPKGQNTFWVTAYNSAGVESAASTIGSKAFQ